MKAVNPKCLFLFVITFFACCTSLRAQLWYSATFDNASIDPSTYVLTDTGVPYSPQDQGTFNVPQRFTQAAYSGTSLQNTAPDGSTSDRFEYIWVSENDANAPAFDGVARFLGFAQQFMPGSAPPNNQNAGQDGTVFAQFWQGGSSTNKLSPPVYFTILSSLDGSWTC